MLTEAEKAVLKQAAASEVDRSKRIDHATAFVKEQNPKAFFHDTDKKPDPTMKLRKFYDEPRSLILGQDYESYVTAYKPPVFTRNMGK